MPTLHVVVTKEWTFRGKPERWSNGYNFQTGSNAITPEFAEDVAVAVRDMERLSTSSAIKFPYLVAGELGMDAVFAQELDTNIPVGDHTANPRHPELCILAQSKIGPKRYLMKYYHAWAGIPADGDDVLASDRTALEGRLAALTNASLPGGVIACRPNGALATEPFLVDPYVRTHQLKRRGKRPLTGT